MEGGKTLSEVLQRASVLNAKVSADLQSLAKKIEDDPIFAVRYPASDLYLVLCFDTSEILKFSSEIEELVSVTVGFSKAKRAALRKKVGKVTKQGESLRESFKKYIKTEARDCGTEDDSISISMKEMRDEIAPLKADVQEIKSILYYSLSHAESEQKQLVPSSEADLSKPFCFSGYINKKAVRVILDSLHSHSFIMRSAAMACSVKGNPIGARACVGVEDRKKYFAVHKICKDVVIKAHWVDLIEDLYEVEDDAINTEVVLGYSFIIKSGLKAYGIRGGPGQSVVFRYNGVRANLHSHVELGMCLKIDPKEPISLETF